MPQLLDKQVLIDSSEKPASTEVATVPAAARTMALFEVFAREKRELTKSELARFLELPESSCSDLLNTLYNLGYVTRTAETRRFYPTGRLLNAATAISENDPLSLFGTEATVLLSRRTKETCTFGALEGDRVKILAVHEGTHRLRYVVSVGDRVSLHGTALGKALLGGLAPSDRARLLRLQPLRRLTDATQTDAAKLEKEVELQQRRGWYQSRGEGAPGVWSMAISSVVGTTLVGLTMIGPSDRMLANQNALLEALLDVKKALFSDGTEFRSDTAPKPRGRPRKT